jgi:hypothetical protein
MDPFLMSSWKPLFVVISYMIIGLDAVAKMSQRIQIRQYELENGHCDILEESFRVYTH